MAGKRGKFRTNLLLFVLLAMTAAFIIAGTWEDQGIHPGPWTHMHAAAGFFMTAGSLVHIWQHRSWIRGVLGGRVKGRAAIRLAMNGAVTVLMVLACLSGDGAMESRGIDWFHAVVGSLALLGLMVHSVRHARWMVVRRAGTVGAEGGRGGRLARQGGGGASIRRL